MPNVQNPYALCNIPTELPLCIAPMLVLVVKQLGYFCSGLVYHLGG